MAVTRSEVLAICGLSVAFANSVNAQNTSGWLGSTTVAGGPSQPAA
jgi:hypothetical protein